MCLFTRPYSNDSTRYLTIIDVDECEDNSMNDCVPEAMCLNTEGSFVCICPPSANDTNGREGEGCFGETNIMEVTIVITILSPLFLELTRHIKFL